MVRLAALLAGSVFYAACTSPSGPSSAQPAETSTSERVELSPAPAAQPKDRPVGDSQPTLPIGQVTLEAPGKAPFTLAVEVASTPEQQQQGLMFRSSLPDDLGMWFVFTVERRHSFWMHNTLIPLDMFFVGADMTVVGVVENATPLTDDPRAVDGNSLYVLEVNAGFAKKHGFGPGTKVTYRKPEEI